MGVCKEKLGFMITITIAGILLISLFSTSTSVKAHRGLVKETPNILVVFSSRNDEIDEHQRILDMLLGGFTDNIVFKASSQVVKNDLEEVTHLFYYGQQREVLPQTFLEIVGDYTGVMVVIGYNVEQIGNRFSFLDLLTDKAIIHQITLGDNPNKQLSFIPQIIFNIALVDNQKARVLLLGKNKNNEYPVFVQHGKNYYLASHYIKSPFSIAFAEVLYEVFQEEGQVQNPAYIRLEDIHPLVDPEKMMDIAKILKEKNIPYMITVIPVYTNPETGRRYHFSDSPKLLRVLKYMQRNGGSIVLHGYTHQFRLSETGEGFEFWDVEYNMPIYHGQDDEVVVKTREDFSSEEEYEDYLSQQKAFERNYIETRITRGIQELANYGLYPLAFEAPHYTMSQHGYEVISEYFSTYVGQLQISDDDWRIMTTVPYMTKPTFLHGMTLIPETIGYVDPDNPQSIEKMLSLAQDYQFVRDGMVGGFYHPYLGVELFIELIEEIEKIPNISWIDLREINNRVNAENVEIISKNGQLFVNINRVGLFLTSRDYLAYHIKVVIKTVMWGIAGIGSSAVIIFIFSIFISQNRNK
ncbi:DUF2334 domain-containing protein [Natronincola ferrireducens]|uniref:Uncharacterized protein YdaL n=1 Tax=Natronincola ferrireducens TaxID=393762 RepID=A0A1G8X845_9FIRM|nr:polysaccharide deacetylase family protein [Natronincola ferrireducens]SDJ86621.1 Uncharacterized protein YdaL [Natronincola ferrireducens]